MTQQLRTLACFKHIEAISPIVAGLSSQCFQVSADDKCYFAKKTPSVNEVNLSKLTATHKISPQLIYHDQHWLISEFIAGENLATHQCADNDKIRFAVKLMAKCHQINTDSTKITKLNPENIINTLIEQSLFSSHQKAEFLPLARSLLSVLGPAKKLVYCHGDVNFSNVFIDQKNKPWLVDFECACLAPAEYDLAMFIAVNNIDENKISVIIKQYEQRSLSIKIDIKLLYRYLMFSYFINSLWYFRAYQHSNDIALLNLHQKQWQQCISLVTNE